MLEAERPPDWDAATGALAGVPGESVPVPATPRATGAMVRGVNGESVVDADGLTAGPSPGRSSASTRTSVAMSSPVVPSVRAGGAVFSSPPDVTSAAWPVP
ncbi:hypothetical protein, partial [Streptomyces sp. PSKA30]|uniref:hypothetical protein n=1 Tax=Streptomyces sp. PSKA30 TaxID=2874597 RepID=UPI001CD05BE9